MRAARKLSGLAGLTLALLAAVADPARAAASLEYAIKAAYLTKFVPFISWPPDKLGKPDSPVTICLAGHDPFDGALDQAARNARVGEHPIAVSHSAGSYDGCQMVFLPAADPELAARTLAVLKGQPVVTVTDSGMQPRGIISFVIDANHVRFDIDEAAADRDGLAISSKLLGLAHAVTARSKP